MHALWSHSFFLGTRRKRLVKAASRASPLDALETESHSRFMKIHFVACPKCHAPDLFTQEADPITVGAAPRREHGRVAFPLGATSVGCNACGQHWTIPEFERLIAHRLPRIHHDEEA